MGLLIKIPQKAAIFTEAKKCVDSFTFSLRFQPFLIDYQKEITHHKPDLIVFTFDTPIAVDEEIEEVKADN